MSKTTGNKFESGRNITETAKLIRADLKVAFPGCKFSVRTSRYSGGQSLGVTAIYGVFAMLVALRPEGDLDQYGRDFDILEANAELEEKISAIINVYNRKDIDSMTDYFNVSFYDRVDLEPIRDAQRKALQEMREESKAVEAVNTDVEIEIETEAVEVEVVEVEAANVLSIEETSDAIADARNLLHARAEAAIDSGDLASARRLLAAIKALY